MHTIIAILKQTEVDMKNIAIIAEYNPFHNGHMYHLNKAKELTGADYSIALMSGSFLQRGTTAMWDKYTRASMATSSGVDLVLELPFVYATGSAKDFATGAVCILDKLNTIQYLCFGAETDDITLLSDVAEVINTEPPIYQKVLTDAISKGISYPQARAKGIIASLGCDNPDIADIINQPNNILAIEYIAALKRIDSSIEPIIIKRKSSMYHDETLYGSISSATAIRAGISTDSFHMDTIKNDIPAAVYQILKDKYLTSWPITSKLLTPYLQSCLLNPIKFSEICDISEDFANKLLKLTPLTSYEDAIDTLSSKDLTGTRINRNLIHLILNYKNLHRRLFIDNGYGLYASILSLKKASSQLIKTINQDSSIPIITKKADFEKYLLNYPDINIDIAKIMWEYDMKATNLYNCLVYNSYRTKLPNDYNTQIPII